MRKLFKHLKPYATTIAVIVMVLIVQAYCDLSLPSYTSDIVNVGIQQGGIDEDIPDAIAEKEMDKLLLFVSEKDQQTVLDAYEKKESGTGYDYDGAVYILKDSVKMDEDKSGKIFDILGKPMLLSYGFESGSDTTKKMEESMKENMISSIKEQAEKQAEESKDLLEAMKDALGDKVTDVKLTQRLKSHPVCLTSKGGLSIEMEKVLNSMPTDQKVQAERVLEINAQHPILETLQEKYAANKDSIAEYAKLLYDQALLIEGLPIDDPVAFSNAVCKLMTK